MRRSLEDVKHMVKDKKYPGIPEELKEFNYYLVDAGHSIMAIPEALFEDAVQDGDLDMYECAVPVKYVLEKGYKMYEGHVIVETGYDKMLGVDIDGKYYEY